MPSLHLVQLCHHLPLYIMPPLTLVLTQYVFVSCVHRRVVEDSVVGSAVCVVHFHVHGE